MSKDMSKVHDELNQKISEIRRLQMELHGEEREHTDDTREKLKNVISTLENEKRNIKVNALPWLMNISFAESNTY